MIVNDLSSSFMKAPLYSLLIWVFALAACGTSSDDPLPEPTSGTITGSVFLFDESSTNLNPSGMRISVENLTPTRSALTDNEGKFSIADVPFGTYTLTFEKEGYGTFKKTEVKHESPLTPITDIPSLGQLSTTSVTEITAQVSGTAIETFVTTSPVANNSNRRYIRYFFSDSPDVSFTNYKGFSLVYVVQDTPYYRVFTPVELNQIGIVPTGTIYIRAYGDSFLSNTYVDPQTQKTIFPNINPNSTGVASVTF
ncbi:MAG: carboxypeptidase regulatory-like domain-containing protein [Cytophagales bacterium]|nr:MAG: carboxypeptidase regulatory-like domain-containing protein [Cytophagales bacterium]